MKTIKTAIYCGRGVGKDDPRLVSFVAELEAAGCGVGFAVKTDDIPEGADLLLSVGGDGTFLSASMLAAEKDIPILGVNFGRLGFLSEARPEEVAKMVAKGEYVVEERIMLRAEVDGEEIVWPYALNEMTVHRAGAAMLGVDVTIDGMRLPTYWADGLLVATPSGSTAYSLSVGGPIVMPEAEVLVVAPISPHNLNVRPLVVPARSKIELGLHSGERAVVFTMDNRTKVVNPSSKISVSMAQFSLKRVQFHASNFINALTGKLFWGEDIRNSTD
ncbi:MAG: NAD(+)/NADH kinase [Bacteroidales bacterium]|nr:NAD(+)/NADH kinase [Bacteroidales bacterium]